MKLYRNIEFVCGGNSGRSPIAEAVARRYFSQPEIVNEYTICSSGTVVDFYMAATNHDLREMIKPFTRDLRIGAHITPEQEDDLLLGRNIRDILDPLVDMFSISEHSRVDEILQEKGLLKFLDRDRQPQQTKPRKEAELIFAISQSNYERVEQIYQNSGIKKRLILLGEFDDPFFTEIEEHREIADQIEQATINVLEKMYPIS